MTERTPDVENYLHDLLLAFRDSASESAFGYFAGAIDTAFAWGIIDANGLELWQRRMNDVREGKCPDDSDHDAECRTWCAICGSVTTNPEAFA